MGGVTSFYRRVDFKEALVVVIVSREERKWFPSEQEQIGKFEKDHGPTYFEVCVRV